MKTLNIYLGTTSGGKRDLMKAFGQGTEKHGVKVDYITEQTYKPSDYAFIFAYKSDGVNSPCLLYTSPSPRDRTRSRMPSSA